jgi:hypothetical protein
MRQSSCSSSVARAGILSTSTCCIAMAGEAACRQSNKQPLDEFVQRRLADRAEEVAQLKAQVKRLERSRACSVSAVAQSVELVTVPKTELEALQRDLAVCAFT